MNRPTEPPSGDAEPTRDDSWVDDALRAAFDGFDPQILSPASVNADGSSSAASKIGADQASDTAGLPARIGRYRVLGEVAHGGIGTILRAYDDELSRELAIKLLRSPHDPQSSIAARFVAEAQIAGQLEHPSIVPVHELGELEDGRPYFTMKLIRGRTLASILKDRSDSENGAGIQSLLGVFEQICQALAYAHSRGVVHRDLKPLNIMVGAFGEVQVMDWGLSKVLPSHRLSQLPSDPLPSSATAPDVDADGSASRAVQTVRQQDDSGASLAGSVLGTPAYMSPEQARGEVETVDARTDVFGLGAILCEIITGEPPFVGATTRQVVAQARAGDLGQAHERIHRASAEGEIRALALSCLQALPENRPADATRVAETVTRYLGSVEERARHAELRAAEARVRAEGERKAHRLTVTIGFLVIAAVVIASFSYLGYREDRRARAEAEKQLLLSAMGDSERLVAEAEAAGIHDVATWEAARATSRSALELVRDATESALGTRARRLHERAESRVRVARFLKRLNGVREDFGLTSILGDDRRDAEAWASAFDDFFGTDLREIDTETAGRLVAATGQGEALSPFLVEWSIKEQRAGSPPARWQGLLEVADIADPHPRRLALRRAMRSGDVDALRELASSDDLKDASPSTLQLLAVGLRRADEVDLTRQVLHQAQLWHPNDYWIHYEYGNHATYYQPQDHEAAIRALSVCVALRPREGAAYAKLGRAYRRAGRIDRALEVLSHAVEILPDPVRVANAYALALEANGDLQAAERYHRIALQLSDDPLYRSIVLGNLALALDKQGRRSEARDLLEQAVRLDPSGHDHNNLGYMDFEKGDLGGALRHYRRAVELAPRFAQARKNLGEALLEVDDVAGAVEQLERAVELDDQYGLAYSLLGTAYVRADRAAEAIAAYSSALRLEPVEGYSYRRLLELFERQVALPQEELVELLATLRRITRGGEHSARAYELFPRAWIAAGGPAEFSRYALQSAEVIVQQTNHRNPGALRLLGDAQLVAGKRREGVLTLEQACRVARDSGFCPRLGAARESLLPDLVSYASVDWAVERLPPGLGFEEARDRFAAFRDTVRDVAGTLRLTYLESRLLGRDGRTELARERLLGLLRQDGSQPEPYLALWRSFRAAAPPPGALASFHRAIATLQMPRRALPHNALAPVLTLQGGAVDRIDPAASTTLQSSPLGHIDPRVELVATRWRVRSLGGDFVERPVLERWLRVSPSASCLELTLPAGLLLPGTRYLVDVAHLGSDGFLSAPGEELALRTAPAPIRPKSLDLSPHRNADVVRDPGDEQEDAFDAIGYSLTVDGFDGRREGIDGVRGLPGDRRIGVHRLPSYREPNVVQLTPQSRESIRLSLPAGKILALRFLVAAANGDAALPVRLVEAREDREAFEVAVDDWFDDGRGLAPLATAVYNGMDRVRGERFEDRDDAALFEVIHALESPVEASELVLDTAAASWSSGSTRAHIFSIVAMTVD